MCVRVCACVCGERQHSTSRSKASGRLTLANHHADNGIATRGAAMPSDRTVCNGRPRDPLKGKRKMDEREREERNRKELTSDGLLRLSPSSPRPATVAAASARPLGLCQGLKPVATGVDAPTALSRVCRAWVQVEGEGTKGGTDTPRTRCKERPRSTHAGQPGSFSLDAARACAHSASRPSSLPRHCPCPVVRCGRCGARGEGRGQDDLFSLCAAPLPSSLSPRVAVLQISHGASRRAREV